MTVKVNKTVLKSIWQRPLKSVADADPWGIGRRNLTHSVQGINVPAELDTLLKVFILASLVFQSNPGIRERELHPNPMGHGRVWAIIVNLGGHGGCLQRPWFLWPPFRVVLAAGWTEGGIPSACLGHQVSRPLSLWRHPPWQVQIMGVSLAPWPAGSQALQTGIWTSSPSCPLIAFSCIAQPPLASRSVPKTRPVFGAGCLCQGLICRHHRSIFLPLLWDIVNYSLIAASSFCLGCSIILAAFQISPEGQQRKSPVLTHGCLVTRRPGSHSNCS